MTEKQQQLLPIKKLQLMIDFFLGIVSIVMIILHKQTFSPSFKICYNINTFHVITSSL